MAGIVVVVISWVGLLASGGVSRWVTGGANCSMLALRTSRRFKRRELDPISGSSLEARRYLDPGALPTL